MRRLQSDVVAAATRLVVFRAVEIAHLIDARPRAVTDALSRLERTHLVTRIVRGVWADTRHPRFSPYIVVPYLLTVEKGGVTCYVSFASALSLHGMISQIPGAIHVAVRDQHRPVATPVGEYRFHRIDRTLFDGYTAGDPYGRFELATPAKALFDTLYLATRRGRRFAHLPEVELPRSVTDVAMQRWVARISSASLRTAVNTRWQALRAAARDRVDE